jgi:hypothetical protein
MTDNTTACAYINKFGGRKSELNLIAREIWKWCFTHSIHLSAAHIPGVENTTADKLSRKFNDDAEWSLNNKVFEDIQNQFEHVDIDLFASRLNAKVLKYVSRYPDIDAYAIDAFSLKWSNGCYYIFPPFSLLLKILQKLKQDRGTAIIIAPVWETQNWWPILVGMTVKPWVQLPPVRQILHLHRKPEQRHPLTKMKQGAFYVSGKLKETEYS